MLTLEVRDLEATHAGILPRDLSLPPTPHSLRHLSRAHSMSQSMPRTHGVSRTSSLASHMSVQSLYIPRRRRATRMNSSVSGMSTESARFSYVGESRFWWGFCPCGSCVLYFLVPVKRPVSYNIPVTMSNCPCSLFLFLKTASHLVCLDILSFLVHVKAASVFA